MSGVPIHTASPINSRRPSAVTPQTAAPGDAQTAYVPSPTTKGVSPTGYPPAQPGAAPPAPTGTVPLPSSPTSPTKVTRQSSVASAYTPTSASPPPPQPGAAPVPFPTDARRPSLPPPPKVGEQVKPASYYTPQQPPTPTHAPTQYPQQQIPPLPAHQQVGTLSTPLRAQPPASATSSTGIPLGGDPGGLNGPPGYQQDAQGAFGDRPLEPYNPYAAVGAGSSQRGSVSHGIIGNSSAYNGSSGGTGGSVGFGDEKEGVAGIWDTAVSWAKTAGQKLQEGEEAVWRMVDKK